jgi:2-hydroxycyclohexanecarboxyl-CoA dehydrogenase
MKFHGKTALVTGGASGIGAATCRALAAAGAEVIVADMNHTQGEAVAAEIRAGGGNARFAALDVTDRAAIQALAESLTASGARLDILVNGAGWDIIQPFMENTADYWDKIVAINYLGPVALTRALLPLLIASGAGRIVNVASDAGRVGSSGEAVYAGAKGGIIAFTKSLAREMTRHKVRVNCICPGPTDTPLFAAQSEKMREALTNAIPMRRLGKPEEVADGILFFASDRSSFCTGQVLSVSGGLTMVD